MITEFKIFESNEDSVIDMGYNIFLYKNIFFKKTPKQRISTQYNIDKFMQLKGPLLTRRLIYSTNNSIVLKKLDISHYFQYQYNENKLVAEILKKNLIEQITIIQQLISKLITVDKGVKFTKGEENLYSFVERSELLQAFGILEKYVDVGGFNVDLGYKFLGKTINDIKEEIDKFYIKQEMEKYNL